MGKMALEQAIKLVLLGRSISGEKRFGRLALMKHLYFLQEVGGIILGVDFELYNWGPFASEVLVESKRLCEAGEIIEEPLGEDKGYNIFLSQSTKSPSSLEEYETIRKHLAGRKPQVLEAMATLHKVSKMLLNPPEDCVIEGVKGLKPYLSIKMLRQCYKEMKSWGWIKSS